MTVVLEDPDGQKLFPKVWTEYQTDRRSRNIVHELVSGESVVVRKAAHKKTMTLKLLFASELEAVVAELMHRDASGPMKLIDFGIISSSISYVVADGGTIRIEKEEGHESVWWLVIDALDVTTTKALDAAAPWTELARNICTNPSFGVNVTGWTATGVILYRDATQGLFGTGALALIVLEGGPGKNAAHERPITAGDPIQISAYVKLDAEASTDIEHRGIRLKATWTGAAGEVLGTEVFGATEWTRLTLSTIAPAGATALKTVIETRGGTATYYGLFVDGVLIEKRAGTEFSDYFDGAESTENTAIERVRWTGAAHASESVHEIRTLAAGGAG